MIKNLFILISMLFTFSHSQELKDISLQLKWKYQFQFAGFLVAKEKGFYRDAGLEVNIKEFNNSIDIVDDVETGKADFGISDSSLIYDVLSGKPMVAVMTLFQQSPFVLMGLKSSGIKELKDLKNRKLSLHSGMYGVVIKALLQSSEIDYIPVPPIFTLNKLISAEVDMVAAYVSNEPYVAELRNLDTVIFHPKDYGFEGYGDILFTSQEMISKNPETVRKMYEASYRGWEYAYEHIDEVVELIYTNYNSLNKTKEALTYEAEKLKELSGYGKNLGEVNEEKVKSIAQIFNIIKNENHKLSTLDNFIYKPDNQNKTKKLLFTDEERLYIKEKKTVKVCVHPYQYPFIIFAKDGYSGMNVEFLNEFSKNSNLKFEFVESKNREEHLIMLKNKKCDIVPIVTTEPNVHTFLTPTNSIGTDSLVIVTKIKEPYIDDLNTLSSKKIAIQKGATNLIQYVKLIYPDINLVEVDEIDVSKVENGKFFAQIGVSCQLSYQLASEYYNELKIMSKVGDSRISGSFGITNREPVLINIFNKLIDNMPQSEKQEIYNSWLNITIEKPFDYTRFIQLISVAIVIILILIFFYLKQMKMKRQIEIEKDKILNIFDNSRDGITILINGIFIDCNSSVVTLLGYSSKEDILNLSPSQMSPKRQPDGNLSLDKSKQMMEIAIRDGYNNFNWMHKKADGSEFWCDIMLTNISIDDKEQILHATWRDITKQKELEDEILEINNSLEQKVITEVEKNRQKDKLMLHQSRLAQMGEMLSMIAHQWRQPLAAISATSASIELKASLDSLNNDIATQKAQDISKFSKHLSETIDDFRDFFKPNKEKREVTYDEIISSVFGIIETSITNKNIQLHLELNSHETFNTYPNELKQVVLNLIKNAEDALLEKHIEKPIIKIETYTKEGQYILKVGDNAGGIPEEIIDNIFNPYFSTKTQRDGTGLGLYMSKEIIEEHCKGRLSVVNGKHGAVFSIIIGDNNEDS